MGHVLNKNFGSQQPASDSALVYRLQVPGAFGPIEFEVASKALSFARKAFPILAGQGLKLACGLGSASAGVKSGR
jgi:hypothetical protein